MTDKDENISWIVSWFRKHPNCKPPEIPAEIVFLLNDDNDIEKDLENETLNIALCTAFLTYQENKLRKENRRKLEIPEEELDYILNGLYVKLMLEKLKRLNIIDFEEDNRAFADIDSNPMISFSPGINFHQAPPRLKEVVRDLGKYEEM